MKKLNIIISPQEYNKANHKNLWKELAGELTGETLILDIPADSLITRLKKKSYRLKDVKLGKRKVEQSLHVLRPYFLVRPEILSDKFNNVISKRLYNILEEIYPNITEYQLNILSYSSKWILIFNELNLTKKLYYYIHDEVKYFAHSAEVNKLACERDAQASEVSDYIFVMSEAIKLEREKFKDKIITVGNGAIKEVVAKNKVSNGNSVGFIGNFRDWIDLSLLNHLIKERKDLHFSFIGPIEKNMTEEFESLINNNANTSYGGVVTKEEVSNYYASLDVVIVPYKINNFMKATRPIKIVEAVFSETPVVTIPMSGYEENTFIRFAETSKEFSNEINYLLNNPIDVSSAEYKSFIAKNSWGYIAKVISKKINVTAKE